MENKLTAVDWLYSMLHNEEVIIYHGLFKLWYKQAKAMEKEQIKDAYADGVARHLHDKVILSEQYFEETYGK